MRNRNGPSISPAIGITSPIAFGADWGDVFFGLGGNYDTNISSRSTDGSGYIGMGFGNAKTTAGLEATFNLISISDDVGSEASFSFKLHRLISERTAVAFGIENAPRVGDTIFPDESYEYLALSHIFSFNEDNPSHMIAAPLTIGVGTGRFNDLDVQQRQYEDGAEIFIATGLIPHPKISLLAEWLGGQLNAGISWTPFDDFPFVMTAALLDLGEEYDEKADFGLAIGYTYKFRD